MEPKDSSDGAGPRERQLGRHRRFCAWHMSWVAQLEGCSEVVQASPSLWEGQHIHLKRHLPHGVRGSAFFRAGAACVSQGQSVGSQK